MSGIDISFTIEGIDKFVDDLREIRKTLSQVVGKALYQFGEEVMTDSKQIVPVLTGALMNTGKVMPPVYSGTDVTVQMGYGDESVGYALYVHEELMSRGSSPDSAQGYIPPHPINYTRPGSGPKYLERPLVAKQDQLPKRISDAIVAAFK